MNIEVKIFGFPEVEKIMGKEINIQMRGNTLGNLFQYLIKTYGVHFKGAFTIKVFRNGQQQIFNHNLNNLLNDFDQITFFRMLPGG